MTNNAIITVPMIGSAQLKGEMGFHPNYDRAIEGDCPEGILKWTVNPSYLITGLEVLQANPEMSEVHFADIELSITDEFHIWYKAFSIKKVADVFVYLINFAVNENDAIHSFELTTTDEFIALSTDNEPHRSGIDLAGIPVRAMTQVEVALASTNEAVKAVLRHAIDNDPAIDDEWNSLYLMKDGTHILSDGLSDLNKHDIDGICDVNLYDKDEYGAPEDSHYMFKNATLYIVELSDNQVEGGEVLFDSCTDTPHQVDF